MLRARALPAIVGAGLALAATSGWATAGYRPASTPGWRVVQNLGPDVGVTDISATGQSNAWAAGITYAPASAPSSQSLFVERWNGRRWHMIAVPKRFTGIAYPDLNSASISGPSAMSAIVVVTLSNNGGTAYSQYGLIWHGHSWSTIKLASIPGPLGIAAFSGSNMWVFESAHRAYALRYNGQRWRRAPLPAYPLGDVTALSASDIWLAGSANNPDFARTRIPVAMHWNGKGWRTLRLPKVPAPLGGIATMGAGMIGLGPSELMTVATFPAPCCGGFLGKPGIVAVRWNGRSWRALAEERQDWVNGPIVADGHGGMWISGITGKNATTVNIVHYGNERFTRQVLRVAGQSVQIFVMFLIPGTRSVWAAGSGGLMLRYFN